MKKLMVVLTAIVLVLSTVSVSVAAEVLQGAAQGYGGTVAVKVSFENGVIAGVEVDASKETQGIGSRAAEELPDRIVESGSAEVDGVSGATVTSDAIKAAVRAAVKAYSGEGAAPVAMTPGVCTATVKAHNGDLTTEVTVDETTITDVKITAHKETYGIGAGAFFCPVDKLPAQIVEHQTVVVDTIAGATVTSAAIKAAVRGWPDGCGRVQNENSEIIPGLYAAGEVALTGQLANVYPSCGLAIGNSVHMGRNAAEAACND